MEDASSRGIPSPFPACVEDRREGPFFFGAHSRQRNLPRSRPPSGRAARGTHRVHRRHHLRGIHNFARSLPNRPLRLPLAFPLAELPFPSSSSPVLSRIKCVTKLSRCPEASISFGHSRCNLLAVARCRSRCSCFFGRRTRRVPSRTRIGNFEADRREARSIRCFRTRKTRRSLFAPRRTVPRGTVHLEDT